MPTQSLGELEQQIMEIIWTKQEVTVREVQSILQKTKPVAYTTVATIVQRLYDKRLLKRTEHGKGYVYSPKLSKESYSQKIIQAFLAKLVTSYGDIGIASFAESIEHLPKEKKEYLLELLKDHENK